LQWVRRNQSRSRLRPFTRAINPALGDDPRTLDFGLWTLDFHPAYPLFFKQARTRSSTVAFSPSVPAIDRTASCASGCLNPNASNASTASLIFWSPAERARSALRASHAPAAPILSRNSTTIRSAVL